MNINYLNHELVLVKDVDIDYYLNKYMLEITFNKHDNNIFKCLKCNMVIMKYLKGYKDISVKNTYWKIKDYENRKWVWLSLTCEEEQIKKLLE